MNYDSIGVGAGVRGASKSMVLPFIPVAASESPRPGTVINNNDVLNVNFYLNLRAQMWWELRIRCERAYQHLNGIQEWSLDEMVSLPNHPTLIPELSQPTFDYTESGKIRIESKKQMAKRGLKSQNYADAVHLVLVKSQVRRSSTQQQAPAPGGWT